MIRYLYTLLSTPRYLVRAIAAALLCIALVRWYHGRQEHMKIYNEHRVYAACGVYGTVQDIYADEWHDMQPAMKVREMDDTSRGMRVLLATGTDDLAPAWTPRTGDTVIKIPGMEVLMIRQGQRLSVFDPYPGYE